MQITKTHITLYIKLLLIGLIALVPLNGDAMALLSCEITQVSNNLTDVNTLVIHKKQDVIIYKKEKISKPDNQPKISYRSNFKFSYSDFMKGSEHNKGSPETNITFLYLTKNYQFITFNILDNKHLTNTYLNNYDYSNVSIKTLEYVSIFYPKEFILSDLNSKFTEYSEHFDNIIYLDKNVSNYINIPHSLII